MFVGSIRFYMKGWLCFHVVLLVSLKTYLCQTRGWMPLCLVSRKTLSQSWLRWKRLLVKATANATELNSQRSDSQHLWYTFVWCWYCWCWHSMMRQHERTWSPLKKKWNRCPLDQTVGTIWHPLKELKTKKRETGVSKMPVNLCFCADQGNIFFNFIRRTWRHSQCSWLECCWARWYNRCQMISNHIKSTY